MRICLISREYPPDTGWGGIATFSFHLAHGLSELGHEVHVIALAKDTPKVVCEENARSLFIHRVVPHIIPGDLGALSLCMPYSRYVLKTTSALWNKFFELHQQKPFDIADSPELLAEGLFPAITQAVPLVIRLYTPHSKFIAENLNNVTASFDHQFVAALERMAMLNADVLTSPSQDLANFVAADLGIESKKIHIVRNPIDPKIFNPEGTKALPADDRLTVLFVGRLEERKGISYLIDAVPHVLERFPQVRFVIIGEDTLNANHGQHSVLTDLKRSLSHANASQNVIFIPRVNLNDLPAYYRSADICVVPSVYDNSPYACLEAMACGKPVIGTSGGGTPEYIVDGESGLIVPPRDPANLTAAMVRLLSNPAERHLLGKAARQQVLRDFQRTTIAAKTVELYEKANSNFASANKAKLYQKHPQHALVDASIMLFSLDKMLYDLLYQESWRFRIRHWFRLSTKRPRLFLAKVLLAFSRLIARIGGKYNKSKATPALLQQLEKEVIARQEEPLTRYIATAVITDKNP